MLQYQNARPVHAKPGLITYHKRHRFGEQEQITVAKTPLFDKLLSIDRNFGKISYRAETNANAEAVVPLYRLRISLNGAQPAIWREFVVPSDISLVNFHVVIQAVMGWTNSHLHLFRKNGVEYTFRYQSDNYWDEEDYIDYSGMKIANLMTDCGDSVTYLYDYGDSWKHTIELLEVIKNTKVRMGTFFLQCLAGERRCPAEDSGGVHGYHEMLKILKNPAHSEYRDTVTWLGDDFDPNYFNLLEVNNILASYCKA